MLRLPALLVLLLTTPLSAGILIDPPAPTNHSFVRLQIDELFPGFCRPLAPAITTAGEEIEIFWPCDYDMIPIPGIPNRWQETVPIGVLAPGAYRVILRTDAGVYTVLPLFVREAEPEIFLLDHQYASTRGGSMLLIARRDFENWPEDVSEVLIDGSSVTFEFHSTNLIRITAPAHDAGFADLVVVSPDKTFASATALRYVDPAASIATDVFERVLVPIVFSGTGAYGSQWITEGELRWLRSMRGYEPFYDRDVEACESRRCIGGLIPFAPAWGNHPRGLILPIPRAAAPDIEMSLRARELSLASSSWGAEIPIARETDFRRAVAFLPVPFDGAFRLTLRLYALEEPTRVTVSVAQSGVSPVTVAMTRSCSDCSEPWYTEVDLLATFPHLVDGIPRRISAASVTLVPTPGIWGFITVTHNESHHVTVASPGSVIATPP